MSSFYYGHVFSNFYELQTHWRTTHRLSPTQITHKHQISSLPESPCQWPNLSLWLWKVWLMKCYIFITFLTLQPIRKTQSPIFLQLSMGQWSMLCWRWKPPRPNHVKYRIRSSCLQCQLGGHLFQKAELQDRQGLTDLHGVCLHEK